MPGTAAVLKKSNPIRLDDSPLRQERAWIDLSVI